MEKIRLYAGNPDTCVGIVIIPDKKVQAIE